MIRETGNSDVILAFEKGLNNYVKVDDEKCKAASVWWTEKKSKWEIVRKKWDRIYARSQDLSLKRTVDNEPLFMKLFADDIVKTDEINKTIDSFINN